MRRYLALWFPFLQIDALRRGRRTSGSARPDDKPLVLVEKVKSALRLALLDDKALALGLVPGLTLADARARIPDLEVADFDPAGNAALLEKLADLCDLWTPLVTVDPPAGLVLDITGCGHLFGGEAGLRSNVHERLQRLGFSSRSAIASTPDAARALARFGHGLIVPPDHDAAVVRDLPVAALEADADVTTALTRAGLKTIGDLADRPAAPFTARFGAELVSKLQRVLGHDDKRITPRRLEPMCMIERRFAEPISRAEDIEAALIALAMRAASVLEARGEGGRSFEAAFFRTDGHIRRIAVETGRPSRDPHALLRLYQEKLEALTEPLEADFGFDLIRLSVPTTEPLEGIQFDLVVPSPPRSGGRRWREAPDEGAVPHVRSKFVHAAPPPHPTLSPTKTWGRGVNEERLRGEKTKPALTLVTPENAERFSSPADLEPSRESRVRARLSLLDGGRLQPTPTFLPSMAGLEPAIQEPPALDGRVKPGHGEMVNAVLNLEAFTDLLDRLIARFGKERVLCFMARDTHEPEREMRLAPAASKSKVVPWRTPEPGEPPIRPIHLFDPPQPIEAWAEVPDAPPKQFTWRRVMHKVAGAEGPERIEQEWWRHSAPSKPRDYYRVEDSKGHRFWLYREGPYVPDAKPKWFLHGLFA